MNEPWTADVELKQEVERLYGEEAGERVLWALERIARFFRPEDRIVDWKAVQDATTLSKRTIQRLMNCGLFPERMEVSPSRSGWRQSDLERWFSKLRPLHGPDAERQTYASLVATGGKSTPISSSKASNGATRATSPSVQAPRRTQRPASAARASSVRSSGSMSQ